MDPQEPSHAYHAENHETGGKDDIWNDIKLRINILPVGSNMMCPTEASRHPETCSPWHDVVSITVS